MATAKWPLLALLNVAVATAEPPSLATRAANGKPAAIDTPSGDRAWDRPCCNHIWGQILVGEGTADGEAISLEGVGCSGDESRSCCDLVVRGQQVVVTGELHENHYAFGKPSRYSLGRGAKICSLDGATAR